MKNRTKSDQHTQAHIEDLCLVRSKFEFSAGRGLFGQNNHSKEKKKKRKKQYKFRRQHKTVFEQTRKRNARFKTIRRRSCRRRSPQFGSNFRS